MDVIITGFWLFVKLLKLFNVDAVDFFVDAAFVDAHFLLDFFVEVETEDFGEAEEINCNICEFGAEVVLALKPGVEGFADLAVEKIELHVDVS